MADDANRNVENTSSTPDVQRHGDRGAAENSRVHEEVHNEVNKANPDIKWNADPKDIESKNFQAVSTPDGKAIDTNKPVPLSKLYQVDGLSLTQMQPGAERFPAPPGNQRLEAGKPGAAATLEAAAGRGNQTTDARATAQPGDAGNNPGAQRQAADVQAGRKEGSDQRTDVQRPGETAQQALDREKQELQSHLSDSREGLSSEQRRLCDEAMKELVSPDRKPPLSTSDRAAIMHDANRLFNEKLANGLDQGDRNRGVTAMLHDSFKPEDANQGQHNTCNETTETKVQAFSNPAQQARLFADMYTNKNGDNTVTMPDGKNIQFDANSLKGDREAQQALDPGRAGKGDRDQFVQAMNHLYVNDHTQRKDTPEFYTQERAGQFGPSDTGERRHVGSFNGSVVTDDKGRPDSSPGMGVDDVAGVAERLSNGNAHMAANHNRFGFNDGKVNDVRTAADLDSAWDKNGGKPLTLAVDTRHPMFHADGVGGYGGGHVVVVSDRREAVGSDGKPKMGPDGKPEYEYKLLNWGDKYNGWVSGKDLAESMNPNGKGRDSYSPLPDGPKGGSAAKGDGPYGGGESGQGPRRQSDGIKTESNKIKDDDARKKQEQDDKERKASEEKKRREEEEQRTLDLQKKKQKDEDEEKELRNLLQLKKKREQTGG